MQSDHKSSPSAFWKAKDEKVDLTLVLLNPGIYCLCKKCRSDQLASEEANSSGSALFAMKYVTL